MVAISTWAQPRLTERLYYIGVHGGAIASMAQFSPTVSYMTPITNAVVLGGNGGLVFRYSGHKCCGLQVEVNYMQRGWREYSATDGVDYRRKLQYIEVPFLTHVYFGRKDAKGFLNLGPQIGYCIKDENSGTRNPNLIKQYAEIENRFDWGVAGGIGFYYNTHKAGVYQIEARFNYSLGGIYPSGTTDYFSSANLMDLSLNLAWLWEIKQKRKYKPINK